MLSQSDPVFRLCPALRYSQVLSSVAGPSEGVHITHESAFREKMSMSHDQVIKRMREDLEQLGNEVRNMSAHEPRNVLVSAASGAVFALVFSWLAFKVWF